MAGKTYSGKHRDPNQSGDRLIVLKAGEKAMQTLCARKGITEQEMREANEEIQHYVK